MGNFSTCVLWLFYRIKHVRRPQHSLWCGILDRWKLFCFILIAAVMLSSSSSLSYHLCRYESVVLSQGLSYPLGDIPNVWRWFWLSRLGRLLASSGQRPRMLLNILPRTGQPPIKKKVWFQVSVVLRLRNSDMNKLSTPISDVIWKSCLRLDVLAWLYSFY